MRKIVFIRNAKSAFGGAERYLQNLVALARSEGIACEVFSSGDYGQPLEMRPKIPSFLPNFLRTLLFIRSYEAMLERVGRENALFFSLDRVPFAHIYRAGDGIHSQYLGIKAGGKLINKLKIGLNPKHWITLLTERKLLQNTPCIIANSKFIQRAILKRYHRSEESIEVVYNGVNAPQTLDKQVAKEKIRERLKIPDVPLVSYVGSGYARKGVKEALEILQRAQKSPWIFIVIGKDKHTKRYQALARRLGIKDRVHFLGALEYARVREYLEASDIFLMPTHYEPCSNATLEAMSYANAIITTRQNGASELLSNQSGILESPQDFTKALAVLHLWLRDTDALKQAQEQSLEDIKPFSMEANLQNTLDVVRKWAQKV